MKDKLMKIYFIVFTLCIITIPTYFVIKLHKQKVVLVEEIINDMNNSRLEYISYKDVNYIEVDPLEFNKEPRYFMINMITAEGLQQIRIYTAADKINENHMTKEINKNNKNLTLLVNNNFTCVMSLAKADKRERFIKYLRDLPYMYLIFYTKEEFHKRACPYLL